VPPAVGRFREVHPSTGVSIVTKVNGELLDLLAKQQLDLVVGRMSEPADTGTLTFELLYVEALALAVRDGHPLPAGRPVPPPDLMRFPLVVCGSGTVPYRNTEALFDSLGLSLPASALQTLDVATAIGVVESTDAIWIAPASAVTAARTLRRVELQAPPGAGGVEPVGLFRRADDTLSPELEVFVECLRRAAGARGTTARLATLEPD
jgi:DNA-binding transcriptional LysR family regulator